MMPAIVVGTLLLHGLLGLATFADLESHPNVGFDLENPA
jgi:hypothetical protein